MYMVLPGFRSIEVRPDAVSIRGEDGGVERVVHLDVSTHAGAAPSVQGHSIGRWDDGALVVDTALFAPHLLGNGGGLPSSPGKHLTERFALNPEGGLTYSFEVEDPEYLNGRVTGAFSVGLPSGRRIRCDSVQPRQRRALSCGVT